MQKTKNRKFHKSSEIPIQIQEAFRTPKMQDKNRTSPYHIFVKTLSMENKERILKALRRSAMSPIKSESSK